MNNYYWHKITILFSIYPTLFVFLILLMLVATIIFGYVCLGLFIDETYRPNVPQYPFNIFLDRVFPLIMIFIPTILLLYINPEALSWMQKCICIIIIHTIILAPMMYYWSKHRLWTQTENTKIYLSWQSPLLYYKITISMIYPFIWGFYFTWLRYLRIGQEVSLKKFFILSKENYILILALLLNLFAVVLWLVLLFGLLLLFQRYVWTILSDLLRSIYLELLNYNTCCNFLEKLYKLHFIFFNCISLNAPINIDKDYATYNFLRRGIHNIYYYPFILYIAIFIFILLKIIWFRKLYLSYFLLFWSPIIIAIFKAFGQTSFIKDVCMINYFAQNLNKIHYKPVFWRYVEDPATFYGYSVEIPAEEFKVWEKHYLNNVEKDRIYNYSLIERLSQKVNALQNKYPRNIFIFFMRIKTAYYKTYKLRWNYRK